MSLFWEKMRTHLFGKKQATDDLKPMPAEFTDLSESETTILTGVSFQQTFVDPSGSGSEAETTLLQNASMPKEPKPLAENASSEPEQNEMDNLLPLKDDAAEPLSTAGHDSADSLTYVNYTTVLSKNEIKNSEEKQSQPESCACIICASSGDMVQIDRDVFRIGSGDSLVEYQIKDSQISRTHASIICQASQYYLMDHKSTNGTFLEGVKLKPFERQELRNGSIFSLADESFQFFITDRRR